MAKEESNSVAIVAIVVIVLIAIGLMIYFFGGFGRTKVSDRPNINIETPIQKALPDRK